jgi:hypothetical protein
MTDDAIVKVDPDLRAQAIVRRYLDLPKYLDLLRSATLYLQRADGFADRFEGALTPLFRRSMNEAHAKGQIKHNADYFWRRAREGCYVNCWSLGPKDNMALWQLYGGGQNSLAITSTLGKLMRTALEWQTKVLIHKVEYIDHFKSPDMIVGCYTDLLRFKHEAYKYEAEVRIVVPKLHEKREGNLPELRLPVRDLNALLRSVVVSPEAGDWFYELVKDVSRKYGITVPIRRSRLTSLPK